jgi:Ca2+-binding RTX toxin-like protein
MVIKRGTPYADTLHGTEGDDTLYGLGGYDRLFGHGGDDTIFGGERKDWIEGGTGNDTLHGEAGKDEIEGGEGNDILRGGVGSDTIDGGDGADKLWGGDGGDLLIGYNNDRLHGEAGNDYLVLYNYSKAWGGAGSDSLYLQSDGGVLYGQDGDDWIDVWTDARYATVSGGAGRDNIDIRSFDDHAQTVTVLDFRAGEDELNLTQLYQDDSQTWYDKNAFIAMMDVDGDGRLTAADAHVADNGFSVVAGTNALGQDTLTLHMTTVTVVLDNCDTFF